MRATLLDAELTNFADHHFTLADSALDVTLALQHTFNALTPTPEAVYVPRVREILGAEGDTLRLKQRVPGGVQTVQVPVPAVLGVLPSALPSLPLASVPPPEVYTPPLRETVMLGDVAELPALLHDLMQPDPRITVEDFTPGAALLAEAAIVVGGGKGLAYTGDRTTPFAARVQHGFETLVKPLAASLGGAAAASRAIIDGAGIDAGYQVGQSGRSIAPDVYVAVGISGAVQHLQGVRHSRVIVALNNDPDAPVFRTAHYGLVGDVYTLVPTLMKIVSQ